MISHTLQQNYFIGLVYIFRTISFCFETGGAKTFATNPKGKSFQSKVLCTALCSDLSDNFHNSLYEIFFERLSYAKYCVMNSSNIFINLSPIFPISKIMILTNVLIIYT